jgi:hypothetical protein
MIDTTDTTGTTGTTGTNEPKTYFIMTNEKGDYGCMTFTDYDMYKSSLETYTKLGWID